MTQSPISSADLLVRAGRVFCPGTGYDGPGAVAVAAGRIVRVGEGLDDIAERVLDFPDDLLLPGLVDLHAHPACAGSKYGVDPDREFLPRGVTTVLSQGDAGADNLDSYLERTIQPSRTRVRLALNLSRRGESMRGGCFESLEDADVDLCVAGLEAGGAHLWGIAVNVSELACGSNDPREIMRRAIRAREATGKPLLYGMHRTDHWPLADQLALLQAGDVVTYCLRPAPSSILDERGRIDPAVRSARDRGVGFDVGHGMNSFSFEVAAAALAQGFAPDTISSDQYVRHCGLSPPHDLARTLSKLIAAGMPESEALAAVTLRPATQLRLDGEVGSLQPHTCADLTVLRRTPNAPLHDCFGVTRPGMLYEAVCVVRAGEVVRIPSDG